MPVEIATRLGDTLLDVAHIDADFELAGVMLVHGGELVAAPEGRIGLVDYTATPIEHPAPRTLPFAPGGDRRWIPYAAAALLAHIGLWGVASMTSPLPPDRPATTRSSRRPIKVARISAEPAQPLPDDRARDRVDGTKSQGQAAAARGATGAAGAATEQRPRGHIAIKNTGEEAQLSKAEAIAQARRAGVLGRTQVILDSYASLGGSDRLTSAFDAIDVTAPNAADDTSPAGAAFGFGSSGFSGGGGGSSYGTIGTGRAGGTFSSGTTFGHGWGGAVRPPAVQWSWQGGTYYAPIPHRLGRRNGPMVTICPRDAGAPPCTVDGALDKAVVRRYVKRNAQKLSYCYERELLAHPKIAGLVTLTFSITGDGHVEDVHAAGFDDAVTTCVRDVIGAMELPRGATFVEYVLHFSPPPTAE